MFVLSFKKNFLEIIKSLLGSQINYRSGLNGSVTFQTYLTKTKLTNLPAWPSHSTFNAGT